MSEEEIRGFIRNQNKFMREFRTGIEMIESVYSKVIKLEQSLGFQFASTIDQADETVSAEIETPAPVAQPVQQPIVEEPPISEEFGLMQKLSEYVDDLVFDGDAISPKKFMGDKWQGVMDIVKTEGYIWVRDGKNSRWEKGEAEPYEEDLSGFGKSDTEVDVSEIEWKIGNNKDGIFESRPSDEKAWAFVMGYDRDEKKSTGEPKRSTQALHDYLQQKDYYCDGEYVYTMNKDASFFTRKLMP